MPNLNVIDLSILSTSSLSQSSGWWLWWLSPSSSAWPSFVLHHHHHTEWSMMTITTHGFITIIGIIHHPSLVSLYHLLLHHHQHSYDHDPLSSHGRVGAQVLEAAPNFDVKKKLKLVGESESSESSLRRQCPCWSRVISFFGSFDKLIAVELAACWLIWGHLKSSGTRHSSRTCSIQTWRRTFALFAYFFLKINML